MAPVLSLPPSLSLPQQVWNCGPSTKLSIYSSSWPQIVNEAILLISVNYQLIAWET